MCTTGTYPKRFHIVQGHGTRIHRLGGRDSAVRCRNRLPICMCGMYVCARGWVALASSLVRPFTDSGLWKLRSYIALESLQAVTAHPRVS